MQVYLQAVDSNTGQGINSATITVIDVNGNSTGVTTVPYNNGWFEIETGVNSNALYISAPGYQPLIISNPIAAFSTNKPVILMQQAATVAPTVVTPVVTSMTTPIDNTPIPIITTVAASGDNNILMWVLIGVGAYLILK